MPPPRIRNTFDDSRSDASSTKEKQPGYGPAGSTKRRNGPSLGGSMLKDVTNAPQYSNGQVGTQDATAHVRSMRYEYLTTRMLINARPDRLVYHRRLRTPRLQACAPSRLPTSLHEFI